MNNENKLEQGNLCLMHAPENLELDGLFVYNSEHIAVWCQPKRHQKDIVVIVGVPDDGNYDIYGENKMVLILHPVAGPCYIQPHYLHRL